MKQSISKLMTDKFNLLVILLSTISYYVFSYHTLRINFNQVLLLYTLVFVGFIYLYKNNISLKTMIYIGLFFRLIFIFAIPNLSDDFYRFLWDGRAIINGINPYLILPENNPALINDGVNLYKGMGSMNGSHFTCYPPLNQIAFAIPAIFSDTHLLLSTIVMRITLIFSDVITLIYGIKILKEFKLNPNKILLYFINPFIIIELTGNLHYEGMMIAFLSISIYHLIKNKIYLSATFFAAAVSIKLVPLIFLPVLIKKIGFKKTIIYGSMVVILNILLFLPFISLELYNNFMSSIELYFQNFEFNASIYYIIREIGYYFKGYNIIKTVGRITPFVVILITLLISLIRKNQKKEVFINSMLFVITSYYLLSSIVHPWYIAVPLFLSIFSTYKFPLIWSLVIILSYSAYVSNTYKENLWLVGLEYITLISFMIYELLVYKNLSKKTHHSVT